MARQLQPGSAELQQKDKASSHCAVQQDSTSATPLSQSGLAIAEGWDAARQPGVAATAAGPCA